MALPCSSASYPCTACCILLKWFGTWPSGHQSVRCFAPRSRFRSPSRGDPDRWTVRIKCLAGARQRWRTGRGQVRVWPIRSGARVELWDFPFSTDRWSKILWKLRWFPCRPDSSWKYIYMYCVSRNANAELVDLKVYESDSTPVVTNAFHLALWLVRISSTQSGLGDGWIPKTARLAR